jgi:hypothetical protein
LRWHGIVLLDNAMSCDEIAAVLLIYDDTVRRWYGLYGEAGLAGLARPGYEGGECRLSEAQQTELKAWITDTLPRSPGAVGAFIAAPSSDRNPPEIFCRTFILRTSCSARLWVKGTVGSWRKQRWGEAV